jgi:hypothetical protein
MINIAMTTHNKLPILARMPGNGGNRDQNHPPWCATQNLLQRDQNGQQTVGKGFERRAIIDHQPINKLIDPLAQRHIQLFWKHGATGPICSRKSMSLEA